MRVNAEESRESGRLPEEARKEPSGHPDSGAEQQSFAQRFAALSCVALRARQAAFGLTTPSGTLIEVVAVGAENSAGALGTPDADARTRRLLEFVLADEDLLVRDFGAVRPAGVGPEVGPLLGLRLYYGGRCGGALCFTRAPGDAPFSAEDQAAARALRRFLEQQDLAEIAHLQLRTRLMNQIAHAVSFDADLNQTLKVVFHELGRHIPLSFIAVWRGRDDEADLVLTARGEPPPVPDTGPSNRGFLDPGQRLPLQGPFQACIKQGKTVYLDRLKETPAPAAQEWAGHGFTHCLAVPLSSGHKSVGVLQVLGARPQGLTRWQIQLVCSVADLLGPAIANFQLYERLNQAFQQLQKAQEQLVSAEKMRALGEMASGMAHDFNNALCGMLGFIELALQDAMLNGTTRETLTMAKTCAMDAASTVRRVQDFTRWTRGVQEARVIDPNQLLHEAANLTRPRWQGASRDHPIEMEVHAEARATIVGSPAELREVLTNLVFNAVDAMPEGGRLILRASSTNSHVILSVEDTGVGMSEEVRQRLFEPFFSTKKERGTGLGLSVSYAIVKRHNGTIEVASMPGRGTRFTIVFPAAAGAPGLVEHATRPRPPRCLRILVIDDEPRVLLFLKHSLTHLGHEAETASDASEGLERFREQPHDLVITDMGMTPMDGAEVVRAIRGRGPDTPIILLTGWAEQIRATGRVPEGVDLVLAKPLTLDQLSNAVSTVCGRGPAVGL